VHLTAGARHFRVALKAVAAMQVEWGGDGSARALDPDLYRVRDAERIITSFASAARIQSSGAVSSVAASTPRITASDVRRLRARAGEGDTVEDGTAEAVAERATSNVRHITVLAYQLFTVRDGRREIEPRDIRGALQILAKRSGNRRSTSTAQVTHEHDPDDSEAGDLVATGGPSSDE